MYIFEIKCLQKKKEIPATRQVEKKVDLKHPRSIQVV